jgi:hypothetical protein
MVWDLRGALLKKAEVESARLNDFEFRLRARTMRLLAEKIGLDTATLTTRIAVESDQAILAASPELAADFDACRAEARRQLIEERGDPTPHKLA